MVQAFKLSEMGQKNNENRACGIRKCADRQNIDIFGYLLHDFLCVFLSVYFCYLEMSKSSHMAYLDTTCLWHSNYDGLAGWCLCVFVCVCVNLQADSWERI